MNREKIQTALSAVHHHEKAEGRVAAARRAILLVGLNYAESCVLLNAIHVKPDEVLAPNGAPWGDE